jgi:hypothetical protein
MREAEEVGFSLSWKGGWMKCGGGFMPGSQTWVVGRLGSNICHEFLFSMLSTTIMHLDKTFANSDGL